MPTDDKHTMEEFDDKLIIQLQRSGRQLGHKRFAPLLGVGDAQDGSSLVDIVPRSRTIYVLPSHPVTPNVDTLRPKVRAILRRLARRLAPAPLCKPNELVREWFACGSLISCQPADPSNSPHQDVGRVTYQPSHNRMHRMYLATPTALQHSDAEKDHSSIHAAAHLENISS